MPRHELKKRDLLFSESNLGLMSNSGFVWLINVRLILVTINVQGSNHICDNCFNCRSFLALLDFISC